MKKTRQEMLLALIASNEIETQEELSRLLNEAGFAVTQATVSRDIRELKLMKVAGASGRMKYVASTTPGGGFSDKYRAVFREGFVSADTAQNILVIKTVSGMAMALAAALDAMNCSEIVGSIAGDDTIMCAVKTVEDAEQLRLRLIQLAGN